MKVRVPMLMLGPFLRPFLIVCIFVPSFIAAVLFVVSRSRVRSLRDYDLFVDAAINLLVISLFFAVVFVCLWLLGMP
jgi:hypothetical protein